MGSVNNDAPYLNVVLKLNHMSVVSDEIQGIRNMQKPLSWFSKKYLYLTRN